MVVHRGNCRAITSNSNDGFGDLSRKVDKVFDSTLKEDYKQRENSSPDGISESDTDSQEGQELFSEFAIGEWSDDVIPSIGSAPQWRHKRSPDQVEKGCYTGNYLTVTLSGNRQRSFPICKSVTSWGTACASSMKNNNNQRKCKGSRYLTVNGTAYPLICTCA